mgnify:CR=1 FL=1
MRAPLFAFAAGFVFGLGLWISGMANPRKVLGFLDVAGNWDPSLMLVMGGALAVTFPGYRKVLRMAKPCGRCRVTTIDQSTGVVTGPEPLATLAGYRSSAEFGTPFGMNAVTLRAGMIRVGDVVR